MSESRDHSSPHDEPPAASPPEPRADVIDRAVLAERRARRAEAAADEHARRAAEALAALETLEQRSADLQRRLQAPPVVDAPAGAPPDQALADALVTIAQLRREAHDQRLRLRASELARSADAVALASLRASPGEGAHLREALLERRRQLDAALARVAAAEAAGAADRERIGALEDELRAASSALDAARRELEEVAAGSAERIAELERRLAERDEQPPGAAETALRALEERLASLESALADERAARAEAERAAARASAEAASLRARLEQIQRALSAATEAASGAPPAPDARAPSAAPHAAPRFDALQARIAELERTASAADPTRHAAQRGGASASGPVAGDADRLAADLDAASAALRARTPLDTAVPAGAPPAVMPAVPAGAPPAVMPPAAAALPGLTPPPAIAPPQPVAPRPAPAQPHRREILVERREPPRGVVVGSAQRHYPWLRGALVKLAHDDPGAAAGLLLALVPALRAVIEPPIDFDLTIRGSGTYAVTLGPASGSVRPVVAPRSRFRAAYHVTADIVALAEVVAGVQKRIGRWHGSVRVKGHRRGAEQLAAALRRSSLSLPGAARAGGVPPPELAFRAFPYVIHPAWTRGHRFTVAQEITDPPAMIAYVVVRDGAPVAVETTAPPGGVDATVSMTHATFAALMRGEPVANGFRPVVRGDREAVAQLKRWTDRAQDLGAA